MLGHPTLAVARPNMGDLGSKPEPRARHPAHPGKIQLITEGFPDIRAEVTAADGRFWTTCSWHSRSTGARPSGRGPIDARGRPGGDAGFLPWGL